MNDDQFERIVESLEDAPLIPERLILQAIKSGVRIGRHKPKPVTALERRVLQAASFGMTSEMTAEAYGLADSAVKEALRRARYKLSAKNTTHAVALALRADLIF